jgi:predicted small metal-binding protein
MGESNTQTNKGAASAKNCDWQVSGNSEQEIMLLIEQHSKEKHGLKLDDETRNGVYYAIHKRAA